MERRRFLAGLATTATIGSAGCMGGEVIEEVKRSVTIDPDSGWVKELPDVEGDGSIAFTVRGEARFDVWIFTDRADLDRYRSYLEGEEPDEKPDGHDLGTTATSREGAEGYEAATNDGGAQADYGVEGPSWFVVDNTTYLGVPSAHEREPINPFVDLELTKSRLL